MVVWHRKGGKKDESHNKSIHTENCSYLKEEFISSVNWDVFDLENIFFLNSQMSYVFYGKHDQKVLFLSIHPSPSPP